MYWKKMVIGLGREHECAFGHTGNQSRHLNREFFQGIMERGLEIPEWQFVLDDSQSNLVSTMEYLLKYAWVLGHPYSLHTSYENLSTLDTMILQKSREVRIGYDECQVPEQQTPRFYRALDWARGKGIWVEVAVELTEQVVDKLLSSLLLDRLLSASRRLHLLVPKKSRLDECLSRARFLDLLDYVVPKLQRPSMFGRLELDPCLLPMLMPEPLQTFPACASQETFYLLDDGSVKICPQGPSLRYLSSPDEFSAFLNGAGGVLDWSPYQACSWRRSWNVQETKAAYQVEVV